MGFKHVESSPLTRSSYHAEQQAESGEANFVQIGDNMKILETERLIFAKLSKMMPNLFLICSISRRLSNISAIEMCGTLEQSREFIETRYRKSYAENGFGLSVMSRIELPKDPPQNPNRDVRFC